MFVSSFYGWCFCSSVLFNSFNLPQAFVFFSKNTRRNLNKEPTKGFGLVNRIFRRTSFKIEWKKNNTLYNHMQQAKQQGTQTKNDHFATKKTEIISFPSLKQTKTLKNKQITPPKKKKKQQKKTTKKHQKPNKKNKNQTNKPKKTTKNTKKKPPAFPPNPPKPSQTLPTDRLLMLRSRSAARLERRSARTKRSSCRNLRTLSRCGGREGWWVFKIGKKNG